ncbi:hypothetical protein ABOM_004102 [Aspergillus bombycis]|uniref:Uncharacterized protein n=1 Tax=Aspergillus bombycis TaxID=109264 RepID=A0A1F8ACC2_9EURO|nr:hypothetical protein ABOM_004102 [Aspergillus bombycis]OGM49307.1 hypothetical protein ABOM_004102 [Aspergillus bombycis]
MPSVNLDCSASSIGPQGNDHPEVPIIDDNEPLVDVVRKLSKYFALSLHCLENGPDMLLSSYLTLTISDVSYTFEQIGSTSHGYSLRLLIHSLVESSHNTYIVPALMILKWQFDNAADYDWGVSESRGYACEYVAWQIVCHLNQRETLEYLLEELTWPTQKAINLPQAEIGASGYASAATTDRRTLEEDERAPLLLGSSSSLYRFFGGTRRLGSSLEGDNRGSHDFTHDAYELEKFSLFFGLNALEIATIAHAKKFLSQKVVQRVIDHIWKGEIVFWDTLSVHSTKKPHFFNKRTADPYSRLRVPVYRKAFEAAFFVSFLILYYAVLVERKPTGIGIFETLMYFWIAAFAYDENLIPLLCIRPLRLFLPAEHIRRVRIVLLRATHLPFVALIWAYESSRHYVSRRNSQWPPIATARGSSRPVSSIQTGLAFSTADARSLSSGRARKQPNPEQYIGVRGRDAGPAGSVDLADMIDEVERLRTQVERVAATVAFHHRVQ